MLEEEVPLFASALGIPEWLVPMAHTGGMKVLGLAESASKDEIVEAHRRLMQKLHPDRGGSSYLAAVINQAKDTLLGK